MSEQSTRIEEHSDDGTVRMPPVQHVHRTIPTPVQESVEITRGQKGGYGWTIKAATVDRVAEIDADLRSRFGGGEVA